MLQNVAECRDFIQKMLLNTEAETPEFYEMIFKLM